MDVYIVKNQEELARRAYQIMLGVVHSKDNVILGLATGSSPVGVYDLFRQNKPDVSHVITVNLDEYIGLPADHQQSYAYFMKQHLFNHLKFKEVHIPNGMNPDHGAECARYDGILAANIPDLQLLAADVPKKAFTMGIKSIMQAKEILLIASGVQKAQAIKEMLEGKVTQEMPASILQNHPNVIAIIDQEAASLIDPTLLEQNPFCGYDKS
ncbi:hypothetical protein NQ315_005887 [Exocentrus adspersus]|uniref:Glucosamine-6-phosphate deaminase n=1 Tax=Exocentrus adspersus TaxID=1586481 RepID=A0AAV8V8W0_9CUCU|nr:hypothetical protein NQ315_005887 [Exocentrus adspersus]